MSKIKIVNAAGLACPQPVVLAKQAIESCERVKVIVDNDAALENVRRLGLKLGCEVKTEFKSDGTHEIHLCRVHGEITSRVDAISSCNTNAPSPGPFVIVISENKMGRGCDELGFVLIRSFLHTICMEKVKPDLMIFYNTGVKLTVQGSEVLNDLKGLAAAGVELLVCGTCLNYFEIKNQLGVGVVSNMYEIAQAMSRAGRLLTP